VKQHAIGILLLIAFFFIFLFTLSDYGLDTDSPFRFLRGQNYLDLLVGGNGTVGDIQLPSPVLFSPGQRVSTYLFNASENLSAPLHPIWQPSQNTTIQKEFSAYITTNGRQTFYEDPRWNAPLFSLDPGHPPVSDIFEAITNKIFYEKLGVLGDIESHYIFVVFTALFCLWLVYYFTFKISTPFAGVLTVSTLFLYPIFFAESHFNVKDIPEMAFFAGSIVFFYLWVIEKRMRWFIAFTINIFLALGTKANILFLPIIALPWLLTIRKTSEFKKWWKWKLGIYGIVFTGVVGGLFIWSWPYLWTYPFQKILDVLSFYKNVGGVDIRVEQVQPFTFFGIHLLGIVLSFATMPISTFVLLLLGIIAAFRQRKHVVILLLFWLLVPILRAVVLSADLFGSTRQYMEFIPAVAILAGLGGEYVAQVVSRRLKLRRLLVGSILAIPYIVFLVFIIISYHPNENVYFNALVGGPMGAQELGLVDWRSSLSNPYRQAVNWLNAHAEKNAKLAYLDGSMLAISPLWLRKDIHFGSYFSDTDKKGEYIISLVYTDPPKVFPYKYLERFLQPVYTVSVQGLPLVKIWKNDKKFLKDGYKDSVVLQNGFHQELGSDNKLGQYWQVNFDTSKKILSLDVEIPTKGCVMKDGVFYTNDYQVSFMKERRPGMVTFLFPDEMSQQVRFYGLIAQSCFLQGSVKQVDVAQ